jgi:ketosteroid isomerase-like protein
VVLVNVDGRCVRGKEEFRAELSKSWSLLDRKLRFSSSDTIVRGRWAIDTMELERTFTAVRGGGEVRASARTIVALARQADDSWKIARILVLPD